MKHRVEEAFRRAGRTFDIDELAPVTPQPVSDGMQERGAAGPAPAHHADDPGG
jgi:hypothetical protein